MRAYSFSSHIRWTLTDAPAHAVLLRNLSSQGRVGNIQWGLQKVPSPSQVLAGEGAGVFKHGAAWRDRDSDTASTVGAAVGPISSGTQI